MIAISANDLKVKGIKAFEDALVGVPEVAVSVRGQPKFVVMTHEQYQYMRECELEAALAQSRAEVAAGCFEIGSPESHIEKIKKTAKNAKKGAL
jgi:PHD/YefM family antitoxin component YafN of YafNO toxin-antitoxin module